MTQNTNQIPLMLYRSRMFTTEVTLYDEVNEQYIQLDQNTKIYVTIKKEHTDTNNAVFVVLTQADNAPDGQGIILTIPYTKLNINPGYYWWDMTLVSFNNGTATNYEIVIPSSPCRIIPSVYY